MAELSYAEIKSKLFSKNKEKFATEKQIQDITSDINKAMSERESLSARLNSTIDSERQRQYNDHLSRTIEPHNRDIASKQQRVTSLQAEKQNAITGVSKDTIFQNLKDKAGLSSEAETGLQEVRAMVSEHVGVRFEKAFFDYVTPRKISFEQVNLKNFVLEFQETSQKIRRFNAPKVDVLSKFSEFIDRTSRQTLEEKPKGALIFAGVLLIALAFLSWIVLPIYAVLLSGIVGVNVYKGAFYSKAIRKYKELSENISELEKSIKQAAAREYKRQVDLLSKDFDEKLSSAQKEVSQAESLLSSARNDAASSFVFNQDEIVASHKMTIASADQRVTDLERQLESTTGKLPVIEQDIRELRMQMQEVANNIKLKYLDFNKISKEVILTNDFLLDVKDDKPVMFELPYTSILFLYDSYNDMINFCKLLIVQLRNRLSPSSLKCEVWDKETMGGPFFIFAEQTKDLIKIHSDESEMAEELKSYKDLLAKRNELIIREFGEITKYNKAMKEMDSLAEYYQFLFTLSPNDNILNNPVFAQMLGNGAALGIYTYVFLPKNKLDKKHVPLIERVGKIYNLSNGEVDSQSREYTLKPLVKFQ